MLHAGQYLFDKELCYLRTVIVTANVYFKKINTGYTSIPIRMKLTYRELCFCYPVIWSNISFSLNYTLICQVNNTDFTWTLKHITSNHIVMHNSLGLQEGPVTFRIQTLGLGIARAKPLSSRFLMINQIHLLHHHISHEVLIPNWPIQNW